MITEIMSMLGDSIARAGSWFLEIIGKMNAGGVILGAFFVFTSYRLLLRPLIGSASSDVVKGIRGKGNNNQSSSAKQKEKK